MAYKKGKNRSQGVLFPNYLDDYVTADAPVRFFDSFVDSLDMDSLGFIRSVPNRRGCPGYDPRDLLKLYIYGYFYQVRSSRRLARECHCNIEVMWLLRKLTPDFRTISDFRKDNKSPIAKVFKTFNRRLIDLKLLTCSYISVDGSKFKAVNSKDRNFTLNKLDDRLKLLDEHIRLYMERLDTSDDSEGNIHRKIDECEERKKRYEGYRDELEQSGESQVSLTDPDSRLMKQGEGFEVCYNVQTAVDADSHMIAGYEVTNRPTDHGLIAGVASEVKEELGAEILECTADKGYEGSEDHAELLLRGIIPNVIRKDGGCTEEVSFDYNEAEISPEQKAGTEADNLRTCLEAGVIPDVYEGILTDARISEVSSHTTQATDADVAVMTTEQMKSKALEGYFVRDAARNLVYCPQGQTLRQKSIQRGGFIRYCNKLACRKCRNKCTTSNFKEINFSKDTMIKSCDPAKGRRKQAGTLASARAGGATHVKKVVKYILHLDRHKMENRKCLSEHPFGTIKRVMGQQYHFLLRGFEKVNAEMGLLCLSYNMRRAINLAGVETLIRAIG